MQTKAIEKINTLASSPTRYDWTVAEVLELFHTPLNDLLFRSHSQHRQYFDPNEIQLSVLCNIKEGGCPEDCAYCPQSARYDTGVESTPILDVNEVLAAAHKAKENGASRFCMGAAWRSPKGKDLERVNELIRAVKALGLETCATLGMLNASQAKSLKNSGLDFYNHNLDTSPDYYKDIIGTRDYQDRLDTLENVRNANLSVCCGGIIGMGESLEHRAGLLATLANMEKHPESVPINMLVKVSGTPLAEESDLDPVDMVRAIAVARIMMPQAYVRLSAGRNDLSDSTQALCFFAGANSIFYGEKLLTTTNPEHEKDRKLFKKFGLKAKTLI
jgi:biotin synthase